MIRRELPTFKRESVATPESLLPALEEFRASVAERLAQAESLGRVAVLDAIIFETHGSLAVGVDPFPIRVQTPFSVAGAWVVLCEEVRLGEAGISTSGVTAWVRPASGGINGSAYALEVQFVTGLAINRQYRLRLAVVGVKNG